jgi:hypothetical protein
MVIAALILALLPSPSCLVLGAPIPIEVLKQSGRRWTPRVLVEMGLQHDRQWVLKRLLDIVENEDDEDIQVDALHRLVEHGDYACVEKLEAIANRVEVSGRSSAERNTARRLRARLIVDPKEKHDFWLGHLESGTGFELRDAVDGLGDIGDVRAKPVLLKLALEAAEARRLVSEGKGDPRKHRLQKRGAVPSDLERRIALALEKIHMLSTSSPVDAFARAARAAPRKDLQDPPGLDVCPLKVWGIRSLGELGTPAAQDQLLKLFSEYERQFGRLQKVSQGKDLNAYQMFRAGNADRYFREAYKALKKAGRDIMRERGVAGAGALMESH